MITQATGLRNFSLLLACLCVLSAPYLLSSCAAAHPVPPAQQSTLNPDARLQLPAPAGLPRTTSGYGYGLAAGWGFAEGLPHNRATAEYMSVEEPYAALEPAGNTGPSAAAYATYSLTLSKSPDPDPLVKLRWIENYEAETCWVGLANYDSDHWDWYAMADGQHATLPDIHPYLKDNSSVYGAWMVVLVMDGPPCRLAAVRLGDNIPPRDSIHASLTPVPLTMHFWLENSDADGEITNADWDFENDGITDESGVLELDHAFAAPGEYTVAATLTDDDGGIAQLDITVRVVPWSMESDPILTSGTPAGVAMGSDGTLHLAWVETDDSLSYLRYAVNAGDGWVRQDVAEVQTYNAPVLALDTDGEPLILLPCYPAGLDNFVVLMAYREAGNWQTEILDGGALTSDYVQPVLCPYGSNLAAVAYLQYLPQQDPDAQLRFSMDALSGGFETLPLPLSPREDCQPALTLDAAHTPHLAIGAANEEQRFIYAVRDGADWETEIVDGGIKPGQVKAIFIGPGGQPSVTCQLDDYTGPPMDGWFPLAVLTREGPGSWNIARLPDIDSAIPLAGPVSMALDSGGEIMLACGATAGGDWGMHGGTFFAYQSGGGWHSEYLGISALGGAPLGFGRDPQGRPWLAYLNEDLKLATRID